MRQQPTIPGLGSGVWVRTVSDGALRKRILVCGPPLGAIGGGPTHMRNLLASPLQDRYELIHFETGSRGAESPAKDEPRVAAALRLLLSPLALARELLRRRPAVVHINSALVPKAFWRDFVYLLICRSFGYKTVLQFHGGSVETVARGRLARRWARYVFTRADALVVLGRVARRELEEIGVIEGVTVIPNGVDVPQYRGVQPRWRDGRLRRLAFLGRLDPEKGVMEAVEAMRLLRDEYGVTGVELRIAGSGAAQRELERRVQALGLGACVRFAGPLYGARKARFLREADVFIFPSYKEGLPYAVLESLAAGTPVIATGVGDIPDVVEDQVHGLLIPPRDARAIAHAVAALRRAPERLQRMSGACIASAAAQHGLERLARQFAELYRRLGA